MKKLLPIIAILLTVTNAFRKILDKRNLVHRMYSWNWAGLWGQKVKNLNCPLDKFIVGLKVFTPNKTTCFYTWWEVKIPIDAPNGVVNYGRDIENWGNESIVCGRLGKNVRVELFRSVPYSAKEKEKDKHNGWVTMTIKNEYSIPYFAKRNGLSASTVYGIMRDFSIGLYRRMTMDGLYPPDVFV